MVDTSGCSGCWVHRGHMVGEGAGTTIEMHQVSVPKVQSEE